jgi:hypothetical protein
LLGDIALFNLLRCGERSQGSGSGKVLEEHCDSRWEILVWRGLVSLLLL